MKKPMMSGFCANPSTFDPASSHARCRGGNTANPEQEFAPCPCSCHYGDEYECGNCGGSLIEAPLWPNEDEPGEMVYTHIDSTGWPTGENCPE